MLPMVFQSVRKPALIAVLFFLYAIRYTLYAPPALAAEPPNPQPCQNAKFDETKLTDNWLTRPDGAPYITVIKPEVASDHPVYFRFDVDFSKLSALFGPASSDYLEGKFQDKDHKAANISELDPAGISKYHGASQKVTPRAMLDPLKVETVKYINGENTLAESADIYTDFNGEKPKTIWQLVKDHGIPDPETQRGSDAWESGWGKYWDKIPTTYSEFYEGRIIFKYAREEDIQRVVNSEYCPPELPRQITFVMPEFFRTTATTGQLNQVIVPNAAQSKNSNDLVLAQNNPPARQGVLGKIISTCSKFLKQNPLSTALRNVISQLPNIFNPVKDVYAQEQEGCIRILAPGKKGQDPYCALPAGQLQPSLGESCSNQIDQFKKDTENPNVKCTFYIAIPASFPAGTYGIWPVFRIPLISEILNNALFADITEPSTGFQGDPSAGPITNRPGVYSWSTPKAVFEDENDKKIRKLQAVLDACRQALADREPSDTAIPQQCSDMATFADSANPADYPGFNECIERNVIPIFITDPVRANTELIRCADEFFTQVIKDLKKKEPGETDQNVSNDAKERFVGGVNCAGPHQNQKVNFLPKAAQEVFGITNQCPIRATAKIPGTSPPGTSPPGSFPPPDCPGITPASDGNPQNGIETSLEELQCAIIQEAGTKRELISGLPLADVMLTVMNGESGGDQCTFADSGEIGVFQYIASTWKSTLIQGGIDSGTVSPPTGNACWGTPGIDPETNPPGQDPSSFSWIVNFGPNNDGEAWNPFLQIHKTVIMMEQYGACPWSVFKDVYNMWSRCP